MSSRGASSSESPRASEQPEEPVPDIVVRTD